MRDYLFPPLVLPFFILLIILPFVLLLFVFTSSSVFQLVFGVGQTEAMLIFTFIVIGSLINIPIYEKEGAEVVRKYYIFGFIYSVRSRQKIVVAVNLGGCVFPSILALKALADLLHYISTLDWLAAFIITSLVIYQLARPIPGVGIAVPMIVPPFVASIVSFLVLAAANAPLLLLPKFSFSVGVLAALFGADILHLKDIEKIGSGVVSIGGAGTFDGIFLTGIFAVIFSLLLI